MNRICELRKQRGWRQEDLAQKMNVSRQAIGNYESEDRGLDVRNINRLCEIFGCSADYLLCRSELPGNDLTDEEQALVLAFRRADPNLQEAVRHILAPFIREATDAASGK